MSKLLYPIALACVLAAPLCETALAAKPSDTAARRGAAGNCQRSAGNPGARAGKASRRQAHVTPPPKRSAVAVASTHRPAQVAAPGSGAPNIGSGPAAPPSLASQMTVTGEELNARPVTRPGEILEAVPGLIVTQHSGEGKANQYFLRGYNLDHGTDLAITVDDVPVNMRTHAHGQGYADLNWLMPETVNSVEVRKGPYFADEGDFASAGNLHIGLIDSVNRNIAEMTLGSFGYQRNLRHGFDQNGRRDAAVCRRGRRL